MYFFQKWASIGQLDTLLAKTGHWMGKLSLGEGQLLYRLRFSFHIFSTIGHLHNGVILLLRPESFRFFLSCANYHLCYFNLAGITKFKCEWKNEENSGHSSKMTPLCRTLITGHLNNGGSNEHEYKFILKALGLERNKTIENNGLLSMNLKVISFVLIP